jgi:hypothetical protein
MPQPGSVLEDDRFVGVLADRRRKLRRSEKNSRRNDAVASPYRVVGTWSPDRGVNYSTALGSIKRNFRPSHSPHLPSLRGKHHSVVPRWPVSCSRVHRVASPGTSRVCGELMTATGGSRSTERAASVARGLLRVSA